MIFAIGWGKTRKPAWPASSFFGISSIPSLNLDPNFADFLKLLNANRVEFLVIGGYAVGYHGFVRATGDLDIFFRRTLTNGQKLRAACEAFGCASPELTAELLLEPGRIVRVGVPPLRLELMNDISGVIFEECYARRNEESITGIVIPFMALEDLLRNKRAAGRPKDLADIAGLCT